MPNFEIDVDISRASTLPSLFYTDSKYFELSRERIFERTWQFVCCDNDVRSLKPLTLLPGFLDEEIVISRSGESVRCLSNVCTHRGKILIEEECQASLIRCRYHGRRFSLDGQFLSMPEFEEVKDFPTERDNLAEYSSAICEGFIFVSCRPVDALEEFVGEVKYLLADFGQTMPSLSESREYDVAAHWALYCENYLEGFHIPYVHRSLNEIVDYGSYTTELYRYASLQTGFDANGQIAGKYLFIFPNMMFNFYPWGLSVNIVQPLAPDRTRIRYLTYVTDESKRQAGAGSDLHSVEMEDEAVVESVQKGIRSRFYDRGRYSPTREQGTHHFHRLIAEFMTDAE